MSAPAWAAPWQPAAPPPQGRPGLLALQPSQQGIRYHDPTHTYWVWSPMRHRWMEVASTSGVLTASGAKGFDDFFWRRSLIEKQGMRPAEAEIYMALHRDNRAHIGTELHGLIRAELLGGSFHPRQAESLILLATWRREFLPQVQQVVACEAPLVSLPYFYSGTPDLLALVDGLWLVLDWKSKVSEEKAKPETAWPLQLAGYSLLAQEHYGLQVDGTMNLMVWPGGTKEVFHNRADVEHHQERFLGCLAWSHLVRACEGAADYAGAVEHLLRLHPEAFHWVDPPPAMGANNIRQLLRAGWPPTMENVLAAGLAASMDAGVA